MDSSAPKARVAYALIGFAEDRLAPTEFGEAIRASLVPGTSVERYGRRWYMAKWSEEGDGRWIVGKLAFEQATESEIWDEATNDVRAVDSFGTPVQSVPFVVDTAERRSAFELRSQTVRPGTFQGNLQALLSKASALPWRVNLEGVEQAPWDEWSGRVERITSLWITMRRPNPHSPIKELEELWDTPGQVTTAQLVVQGNDIPTDKPIIDGGLGHAFDYGQVAAEAVLPGGATESWRSKEEGSVRKDGAIRDETGHVAISELQRLLSKRARERARPPDERQTQ